MTTGGLSLPTARRGRSSGRPSRSSRGPCARRAWTSTCWRRPSRCSRCPTGTWGCAATSTRASRTGCPAPTSTRCTSTARCRTPRPATATPSRARRSSTSPTARSSGCWWTTSRSTSGTASCSSTSGCSTCAPACSTGRSRWRSPAGRAVRIRSTRLVSFTHRSIVGAWRTRSRRSRTARGIVLQSELVANEEVAPPSSDPRASAVLASPLEAVEHDAAGLRLQLLHRTRRSGIGVAVAADHVVEAPDGSYVSTASEIREDWGRVTVTATLRPGQTLRLVKFSSYGWSSMRSRPALRDQVAAGLTGALHTGWEGLLRDQREFLDDFWQGADVTVEGDPALQQAVRFALFHVLQNSVRAEERPIAAKGLTGPGLRRPLLLGHRLVRAAGARAHLAGGGRRRTCAGGTAPWTPPSAAPPPCTWRAPPSRGGRSTARSAPATGPRAPPRSTSTPTSRTPSAGTTTPPGTTSSTPRSASSCSSRRPGCGARSATTTAPAAGTSAASPGPTSTAPSPTTTSTRT